MFILSLQECVSIDTDGNVALQATISGGLTGGTPGASFSLYHMATNAPSVDKLEGSAYEIGGSAGIPIYGIPAFIGGDFIIIPDSDLKKEYYGLATNLGLGTPGGEIHVTWGETVTLFKFNVFDVFDKIYNKVMEW